MTSENKDYMLAANGDEAAKERVRQLHAAYDRWETESFPYPPPLYPVQKPPGFIKELCGFLWLIGLNVIALAFGVALFVRLVMFFVRLF